MKKIWIVFLVLLCAGMIMTSCPSEPEPPPPPIDANIYLQYGVFEHEFDTPLMEFTKEYQVIIDIAGLDWQLPGCHFQGQLFYKDGGDTYMLASSQNAQPQNIAEKGKKYRVTFTAGKISDEDKGTDKQTAGNYKIPAAGTTKVPDGATQIFRLTAKTPQWYEFGKTGQPNNGNANDSWDLDYYGSDVEKVGIKGTITVRLKPDITFKDGETVTGGDGDSADSATGKGNIVGDEYIKLKTAHTASPESLLRVSCIANVVLSGASGGNMAQPSWDIAQFGTAMDKDKVRGQNPNVGVVIPEEWNGNKVTANPAFEFYVDILIDDILAASEPDWTFLNVYNGAKVTGMVIRVPVTP